MKPVDAGAVSPLAPGEILGLSAGSGWIIDCETGVLWVTEAGCESDWFLTAGERHVAGPGRRVVVEAIEPGRCRVTRTR